IFTALKKAVIVFAKVSNGISSNIYCSSQSPDYLDTIWTVTLLGKAKTFSINNSLIETFCCRLCNGVDPVADAAIRQLTESASRAARKTPTKRSTLIISGVSKVPLSEDTSTLSSGYAAAMDAAVHRNHFSVGPHQDVDETTPSDVSERPSVDDVESDTGSTGGYETRSLKDHKVGFLQSGTKLFFRRRRRAKEPCLSQSHEDVSNMDNNFTAVASGDRKKSGSFSRRLIKRFSFRSSGKSKGKASAKANANGGSATLDK
uniref:Uncharacterized protein n=1 Tax=Gouania willdenowi TaxID=441366 RepID=A0A8C5ELN6_GOUWI